MEFTQEQISEIISEITNGHQGLDGLVKQIVFKSQQVSPLADFLYW